MSIPEPTEVTVTELRRRAAGVLEEVKDGQIAVVSKNGWPVAILLPLEDEEKLLPPSVREDDLAELAAMFERRAFRRRWSELMHGRWYNGHGIHGPYKRRRARPR